MDLITIHYTSEFAAGVYDAIVEAGEDFGLEPAGFQCMDGCRLEKGYEHWGHDLTQSITPLEAGLGFAVGFDKQSDFIGREALLEQRERRLVRRLASFSVHAGEPLLLHDEPLYRDGVAVGVTTSGSFGPRLERPVCIALIEHPAVSEEGFLQEGSYQIEIGSERFDATLHLRPAYDPTGSRLRA